MAEVVVRSDRVSLKADLSRMSTCPFSCSVYKSHQRPLLFSDNPSVFRLATLPALARLAQEFLCQVDKYLWQLMDEKKLPRATPWQSPETKSKQLQLFVDQHWEQVENDPGAYVALHGAADDLIDAIQSVYIKDQADVVKLTEIVADRLSRLAVKGNDPSATDKRLNQILSIASDFQERLEWYDLAAPHAVGWYRRGSWSGVIGGKEAHGTIEVLDVFVLRPDTPGPLHGGGGKFTQ